MMPVQQCHICSRDDEQGINLVNGYICAGCLEEITKTDVSSPRYNFFVHKLKELWRLA